MLHPGSNRSYEIPSFISGFPSEENQGAGEEKTAATFDTAASFAYREHPLELLSPLVTYSYSEGAVAPRRIERSADLRTVSYNGTTPEKVSAANPIAPLEELTSQTLSFLQAEAVELEGAEELNAIIAPYLRARSLDDLYERVMDRLEQECGRAAVQDILALLWSSRHGLDQEELAVISGRKKSIVARVMVALENHLARRGSLTMLLRDELRNAVERRYLGTAPRQQKMRAAIAGHFGAMTLERRRLDEEPWQRMSAGELGELRECVVNVPMTMALILQERRAELFEYWSVIEGSCNLVAEYEQVLDRYESAHPDAVERAEIFHALSDFYAESYRYDMAKVLLERCLAVGGTTPTARRGIGEIPGALPELDELLSRSYQQYAAARVIPTIRGTASRPSTMQGNL